METRFEWRVALAVVVGVLAGGALAAGQAAAPEVVWRATTMAAELPEQVQPGYTLFTIDADAGTSDSLAIFRLREGVTIEEFAEGSDRIDQAFMEGGDVPAAINEALAMIEAFHAEVSAEAGERRSVGVVLPEGRYVLEYTPAEEAGARSYHEMRVEGQPGAEPPTPDASVSFVDFAFAIPADLAAGEQTWHVINRGAQIHHMVIFRLAEGATLEDFMEFMEQGPPMEDEAPPEGADAPDGVAAPADYVGIMSSGEESYHVVDLEAGTYVAVCFLPDHLGDETGMPHFMLGMIQEFVVGQP